MGAMGHWLGERSPRRGVPSRRPGSQLALEGAVAGTPRGAQLRAVLSKGTAAPSLPPAARHPPAGWARP